MNSLLFALRISASDSLRGIQKWTDIFNAFSNGFPPPGFAVAGHALPPLPFPTVTTPTRDVQDKKSEGFVWGVPKHRRTVEKRTMRKVGASNWFYKMLIPKYNLLTCENCGHHYQAKHLCRNCYEKTVAESKIIRDEAKARFGDSPVDKDIVVLYESDKTKGVNMDGSNLNTNDKLLIELPKERPTFFSPNLLQKSTAGINRKTKDVVEKESVQVVHKND